MASHSSSEAHGGPDLRELGALGFHPADILDFSVNGNPYGPSPRVRRALRSVDVSRYPDRLSSRLTGMLASANGVGTENVLVGNGTSELICLAAAALLRPCDRVLIAGPTFGEYARACAAFGAAVVEVRAEPPYFLPSVPALARAIIEYRPRIAFLCNPNNPTGKLLDPESLEMIAVACSGRTTLVVDEAYRAFVAGSFFGPPPRGVDVVLRSMTKDFALAGLRLGYALGDANLLNRCAQVQPAWSVNGPAQVAGEAVLSDLTYYRRTLSDLRVHRGEFFTALQERGMKLVPSDTHFALLCLNEPACSARRRLLEHEIQVRDCASFGLPNHMRVATRLPSENRRLLHVLGKVLHSN